jgi:hypothetical protein
MNKALVAVLLIAACGGKKDDGGASPNVGSQSPITDEAYVQLKDAPNGLDLKVTEGKLGAPAFDKSKLAPATKLSEAEAQGMLARAKPITTDPTDQKAFALRPRSQPVPRTGNTSSPGTFPPPPSSLLPPKPSDAGQNLQGAALHAGGPGADRARAQRDVQPADGGGDLAGRRGEDHPGQADPTAQGQLALARHAHDPVRSRHPVPDVDDLHRRGPGGHQGGER